MTARTWPGMDYEIRQIIARSERDGVSSGTERVNICAARGDDDPASRGHWRSCRTRGETRLVAYPAVTRRTEIASRFERDGSQQ